MENIGEKVNSFLEGYNPMERVVNIECDYEDDVAYVIYNREDGQKRVRKMDFKPFVWVKNSACVRMFDGDRKELKKKMKEFGISVKALKISMDENKTAHPRLENGYKYMFYATKKMSWSKFQRFFQMAKTPIYPRKKKNDDSVIRSEEKEFLAVSPNEQFMMETGIRLFKGYEGYDELHRLLWDIETTGLNPEKDTIDQIGIRTNKGFEKVISIEGDTKEERLKSEYNAVKQFIEILADKKCDVIAGHNSENFDWNFLFKRYEMMGESLSDLSSEYFAHPIYKKNKESVLKLGGEVEYFKPTVMWGTTILDSMHAVRRAQASDSDIKSANLKYVTQYLGLKKENRVYVKGDKIGEIWRESSNCYAFNNTDGDYYKVSETKPLKENYTLTSGRYIVERYLLDDIWETDKVELALNEANFLISKILPTSFQRAATMGTAGIWKLIMLAWCYENNLAIPSFTKSHSFTGGLSRLLKTGYADNVAKLDYNSLYPSIMLTWWVESSVDISNSILNMLNYVLTNREKYKALKNNANKKATELSDYLKENEDKLSKEDIKELKADIKNQKAIKSANDKKQNPLKVLGNSVFGSFGSPQLFPFGDQEAAEFVTCTGRQCLRLMIHHFKELGYEPIVGDSVLGDTPLFIKYKYNGYIDIKPISEIFDDTKSETDVLGRNYDYSTKPYKVLCRSGWSDVSYVYKHNTTKDIYEVNDGKSSIEVTQDHSLFDENKKEIKPTEITENTKLEYYNNKIEGDNIFICNRRDLKLAASMLKKGIHDRLHSNFLNMTNEFTKELLVFIGDDFIPTNKTCLAQIMYLKNKIAEK